MDSNSSNISIYFQNNSDHKGENINSLILSCNGSEDSIEATLNQLSFHIFNNHLSPIIWSDMMENKILNDSDGFDGNRIGDMFRNNCYTINSHKFSSGYVYGGKRGTKYIENPTYETNESPFVFDKEELILMMVCNYSNGKNKCFIEKRIGSIEELKKHQKTVENIVIKRNKEKWEKANYIDSIKKEIIEKYDSIQSRLN